MTKKPTSARHTQFLQQLEQHRRNRPCQRIIDLRGKVAGECQAYLIGGKTHYLDDRAYLLIKQLLAHTKGQYTLGLYEAFHHALKQLSEQDNVSRPTATNQTSILCQDRNQVQFLPFDHPVTRQEERIHYATPVSLDFDDVHYSATTIDITTSAIRLVLKRAYPLYPGAQVRLSFTKLNPQQLTQLEYQILKITHDATHTFVILHRDRTADQSVTDYLDQWTRQHATPDYLDIDHALFNLAIHYYQHIYTRTLTDPVLWLSHPSDPSPIKAWHGQVQTITHIYANLPLKQVLETHTPYLVRIGNDKSACVAVPWHRHDDLIQLCTLPEQHHDRVLLLTPVLHSEDKEYDSKLDAFTDQDDAVMQQLKRDLSSLTQHVRVADITTLCPLRTRSDISLFSAHTLSPHDYPKPNYGPDFAYTIKRKAPRYLIRTPITLHVNGHDYTTFTQDFSFQGIAFVRPPALPLKPGQVIQISFDRWNAQSSHAHFTALPYHVIDCDADIVRAERPIHSVPSIVNQRLRTLLEHNTPELEQEKTDTYLCQLSTFFGSMLTRHMATVTLFLGKDPNKRRIVQAVGHTATNQAQRFPTLWTHIGTFASQWEDKLDAGSPLRFGLYCYPHTNTEEWIVATDLDFQSAQQKNLFIARALASAHPLFFYCVVTAIAPTLLEEEQELNAQLTALRPHAPHKVKQIKSVLTGLFAIAELTDITSLITLLYGHAK